MIPIKITIYKKSIFESAINFFFTIPLFSKSIIRFDIVRDFDHNLDYQFILS